MNFMKKFNRNKADGMVKDVSSLKYERKHLKKTVFDKHSRLLYIKGVIGRWTHKYKEDSQGVIISVNFVDSLEHKLKSFEFEEAYKKQLKVNELNKSIQILENVLAELEEIQKPDMHDLKTIGNKKKRMADLKAELETVEPEHRAKINLVKGIYEELKMLYLQGFANRELEIKL